MLLPDKSGIKCDLCNTSYNIDFTYYSYDFREVKIYGQFKPTLAAILSSPVVTSIDVCTNCFESMKDKIISNNVNRKMAKCDITGEVIGAAAKYYYCVVSKVAVKMTNKLAECKRCKQKSYQHTVCSKCGGNEFIKMADMAIDERFVELTISEKGYNALKESAAAVKRSDWSSTS